MPIGTQEVTFVQDGIIIKQKIDLKSGQILLKYLNRFEDKMLFGSFKIIAQLTRSIQLVKQSDFFCITNEVFVRFVEFKNRRFPTNANAAVV